MNAGTELGPVEQRLCRRIAEVFQGLLPDVPVEGNWLAESSGVVKGTARLLDRGARMDVAVSPLGYASYSGVVAEVRVELEAEFSAAFDAGLERSVAAYAAVAARLGEWHGSVAAVKADLALADFAPAGLRLEPGTWEIDRETTARTYAQAFTVRGVVRRAADGGESATNNESERNSEQ